MSYTFECPECGEQDYSRLAISGPGPDASAHCWACDYNGEIGEAPDYDHDYEDGTDEPF